MPDCGPWFDSIRGRLTLFHHSVGTLVACDSGGRVVWRLCRPRESRVFGEERRRRGRQRYMDRLLAAKGQLYSEAAYGGHKMGLRCNTVEARLETLSARLHQWKPETADQVRQRVT